MKAILIDVKTQEIKEVEYDNTLQNIYDLIDCRAFDLVRLNEVDGIFNSIFVDDEGLLKDNLYFEYSDSGRVFQLAGSGLILGVDDEGNSIPPTLTVEDVKVIDGDEHDMRFLDEPNVVVGLKAKGKAIKDYSGFVIDNLVEARAV